MIIPADRAGYDIPFLVDWDVPYCGNNVFKTESVGGRLCDVKDLVFPMQLITIDAIFLYQSITFGVNFDVILLK